MSTLTADPPTTSHAATPPAAAQVQPTFAGVVRGEWIKLLSLRSTWWALASTAAVITLVALAAAASLNAMADDPALAPGIEQMPRRPARRSPAAPRRTTVPHPTAARHADRYRRSLPS